MLEKSNGLSTDQGTDGVMYKCTAANVWAEYYRTFTYPHLLRREITPVIFSRQALGRNITNGRPVLRADPAGPAIFRLSRETDIILDLYDMAGNRLGTIAGGRYQAGSHKIAIPTDQSFRGLHVLRLRADSETIAVKIVLRK